MSHSSIDELKQCGEIIRPVEGDSMMPMLDDCKDAVKLAVINAGSYPINCGDIILYLNSFDKLILHRVVKVSGKFVFTCGDNRKQVDKVPRECIVGICQGFFKENRYISLEDEEYIMYKKAVMEQKICYIDKSMSYLMHLYASSLCNEAPKTPEYEPDYNLIYKICEHHFITAAVGASICKVNTLVPSDIRDMFSRKVVLNTCKIQMYEDAKTELFRALEERRIEYTPLKGSLICKMYPEGFMREFSDCDLLCHSEDRERIREILTGLGYCITCGKVHDSYDMGWIHVEVHIKLFENASRFANYYSDVWSRLSRKRGSEFEYVMRDEDLYVYLIAHMSKHMPNNIGGLRFYGDFYEIRKYMSYPGFDRKYTDAELAKLGLDKFEKDMIYFTERIFNSDYISNNNAFDTHKKSGNDSSCQLTLDEQRRLKSILYSAAYGSIENHVADQISRYGRLGYIMRLLFPDGEELAVIYPGLRKHRAGYIIYATRRLIVCLSNAEKRRSAVQKLHMVLKRGRPVVQK